MLSPMVIQIPHVALKIMQLKGMSVYLLVNVTDDSVLMSSGAFYFMYPACKGLDIVLQISDGSQMGILNISRYCAKIIQARLLWVPPPWRELGV